MGIKTYVLVWKRVRGLRSGETFSVEVYNIITYLDQKQLFVALN